MNNETARRCTKCGKIFIPTFDETVCNECWCDTLYDALKNYNERKLKENE